MADFRGGFAGFLADDSGATAIEYGLIAGLIAVACLVAIGLFGGSLLGVFNFVEERAGDAMDNAVI